MKKIAKMFMCFLVLVSSAAFAFDTNTQSIIIESNSYNFVADTNSVTFRGVTRDYWLFADGNSITQSGTNLFVGTPWLTNTIANANIVVQHSKTSDYATVAGNADTVDSQHISTSPQAGSPTYVLGGPNSATWYPYSSSALSVLYATTAGGAPPTGSAGGDLSGTYPNPTVTNDANHTHTKLKGQNNPTMELRYDSSTFGGANPGKGSLISCLPLGSLGGGIPTADIPAWMIQYKSESWGGSYDGQFVIALGGISNDTYIGGYLTIPMSAGTPTKTFSIKHPIKSLSNSKVLVHSCIEGPKIDLIYRGSIILTEGTAIVDIDKESKMTSGTFVALTKNQEIFLQNDSGFEPVKGKLNGSKLQIQCKDKNSTDVINWLVIAERNDPTIKSDPRTDSTGSLITEFDQITGPIKPGVMETQDGAFYQVPTK